MNGRQMMTFVSSIPGDQQPHFIHVRKWNELEEGRANFHLDEFPERKIIYSNKSLTDIGFDLPPIGP